MRILHVIPTYLPALRYGGPIGSVHQLARHLAKLGHEVHVFTTNVDGPRNTEVPLDRPVDREGVRVHYFQCPFLRNFYFSPSMKRRLSQEIGNFDLLHLHSIYRWPTWMAARAAERAGIPYIVSPRGMLVKGVIRKKFFTGKNIWIQGVEKRTVESAAAIHLTSQLEADEIKKFNFNLPPVFIVPNGFDEEELAARDIPFETEVVKKVVKKSPFLIFIGRIHWKKGLDRLIPAMAEIPNVHLVIAGNDEDAYQATLERLAGKHHVKNRITFIGPVYGPEKFTLMGKAVAFVLPSYSENFGNSVLEAMAVGCPVVVTPEVGLAEAVKNSGAGLAASGDSLTLAQSIKEVIFDAERLKQMGEAGKKLVHERFTMPLVTKEMEGFYQSILQKPVKQNLSQSHA